MLIFQHELLAAYVALVFDTNLSCKLKGIVLPVVALHACDFLVINTFERKSTYTRSTGRTVTKFQTADCINLSSRLKIVITVNF